MPKLFISGKLPEFALQELLKADILFSCWKEERQISQAELIEACQDCDGLISIGPNVLDSTFLNACKHLKVIALHSVGFDKVDVEEAHKLGIQIGNTPNVLNDATADTALLLMLAVSRKAFFNHKEILAGNWKTYVPNPVLGQSLQGKTLGIFGMGKIGVTLAKKCAAAFEMDIIYHNRKPNEAAEKELNARYVAFDELLAQSDVLSLHTALTEETKGKFDLSVFEKMKPTAIFINTARGAIHNEKDLIKALDEKMIWGAGLDVTNPEPMDDNNSLLSMENVAVLPHIGSATIETRNAMANSIVQNILAGLKGEKLPFLVQ
ncbi:2-hydroxyacid dehydrogenase [Pedobacter sp. MW01-1-1]|uniref:2-hydroxyacid dehydrogenase n=1 Tax=Pedobacter sp. MW01-1-1 TaxID=3383027 RepID=UPI003FED66FB